MYVRAIDLEGKHIHVALSMREMNFANISHYLCARHDIYMQ